MTLQIGILLLLLAAMVYLFLTEKLPVDLTAFSGLVILVLGGFVAPQEAFTGFASSAVITMMSIFIVSAALLHTGFADLMGRAVHRVVGSKEIPLIIAIMITCGVMSAFMNNIAATAVLMPAVASIARQAKLSPSKLFMPLAFGSVLGGTMTLVGTPPNILAAAMLEERGLEPFGLFTFLPFGLAILGVGVIFMATVGRRLLPKREEVQSGVSIDGATTELTDLYQLRDRLFAIRIPAGSPLDGETLAHSRLGTTFGIQVAAIERDGKKILAPDGDTALQGGDLLISRGRKEDVSELLKIRDVRLEEVDPRSLTIPEEGISAVALSVSKASPLLGWSLREIGFRQRFGAVVVSLLRDGEILSKGLGSIPFQTNDQLLVLGAPDSLSLLEQEPGLGVEATGLRAVRNLFPHLYLIRVPAGSPLAGATVGQSRLGELVGVTIGGLLRGDETHIAVDPEMVLQQGDRLLVTGDEERIEQLLGVGEITVDDDLGELPNLTSDTVGLVEASLAPRSSLAGQTLAEISFRERFGMSVLALWRDGKPRRANLADVSLKIGDALLLQGARERINLLARESDFVVLSDSAQVPRRTKKAPFAVASLAVMIAMVMTGFMPIQVAAFTAATLALLSGALTMQEAYQAIEWRAIFLVAAVLPVGVAIEKTGTADLLSGLVSDLAGPFGPIAVLTTLVLLSSVLSQGLDGAPAVVLLTPVVIQVSELMSISPYPLMMGVSLAASAAFMTPFSHKANLLVMGAGGYRSMDYVRVGSPLTVAVLIIIIVMVPMFLPF